MCAVQAMNYQEGNYIDYTNTGNAITGGTPTLIGGDIVGIPQGDIAATTGTGAMQIKGIAAIVAAVAVGNIGDPVWWDSDGDPYGGKTGTGAATTLGYSGDFFLGYLTKAKGATDKYAYVMLNEECSGKPAWKNRVHQSAGGATLTLDIEDSGKVIWAVADNTVITLPATAVHPDVIVVNGGADGAYKVSLSPNLNDKVQGPNITGEDNKDLINTKATAIRYDFAHLVGHDTNGPAVIELRGTWAQEP
ncbi:MAG: hypothetical protein BWY71_00088 [Planctomycetes bacterium ADurb.Bin412]|nr:MAG: hypothetical protein BWY71_00088 [Planctomycetes bacterium ADurb.Bin412]